MSAAGEREASLGITEYLTPGPGFLAITKQRFADFIVHEVSLSGQAVCLESLSNYTPAAPGAADSAPVPDASDAPAEVAAEAALSAVVGLEMAQALCLLQAAAKSAGSAQAEPVLLPRDDDKEHRKAVHQLVKQYLLPLISDTADAADGGKCVRVQAPAARPPKTDRQTRPAPPRPAPSTLVSLRLDPHSPPCHAVPGCRRPPRRARPTRRAASGSGSTIGRSGRLRRAATSSSPSLCTRRTATRCRQGMPVHSARAAGCGWPRRWLVFHLWLQALSHMVAGGAGAGKAAARRGEQLRLRWHKGSPRCDHPASHLLPASRQEVARRIQGRAPPLRRPACRGWSVLRG